ncbi:hypothetical protein WJX73_002612 [Symbiochloris irregularis]|uniref:Protein CASP n=1 Tax=Symbiochloris irregularis TaxID=706552 RepID=A0AAW1P6A3_9CHLO
MRGADPLASATGVCNFWKDFDLDAFRSRLDEDGLAIAERQEESSKQRKILADTTKEFRRGASSETLKAVGALLKSFQQEVDRLTNRAKAGEAAFLAVYERMYEAPDPAPGLLWALDTAARTADAEAQAMKLGRELSEFKAESQGLVNQQLTVRKLEERCRQLEAESAARASELEAAKEAARHLERQDREEDAQERAAALEQALQQAQQALRAMQQRHESSQRQLMSMQARSEDEAAGMQSELELTRTEMERAQQRLSLLEHQRQKLEGARDSSPTRSAPAEESSSQIGLKAELNAQRMTTLRLQAQLDQELAESASREAASADVVQGLRETLTAQEASVSALQAQLDARPTSAQMEDLKQRIRVLQAVGFGSLEADDAFPAPAAADSSAESAPQQPSSLPHRTDANGGAAPLEALLLQKNRQLEHALTMARLKLSEVTGDAATAAAQVQDLERELDSCRLLVQRLEEDLMAAQQHGGAARDAGLHRQDTGDVAEDVGSAHENGDHSMVSVLCAQRDRFRARASQLETDLAQAQAEARAARAEHDNLRADNVALVERLRYVQGYASNNRARGAVDVERGHIEGRYSKDYEDSVNPFNHWRDRERHTRRSRLSVVDRLAYELGQLIAGSTQARLFLAVYTLILHALVFGVLMRWGHSHSSQGPMSASELQLLCHRQQHSLQI